MIVYVETNFLLEIILGQEELEHAKRIIQLAQESKINLRFPSFSLMEPLWTIKSRGNERKSIHTSLTKELNQLGRSVYNTEIVPLIQSLTEKIITVEREDMGKLEETFLTMLRYATPIHISREIYERSLEYQSEYALSPQDSIVYSSIIVDLEMQNKDTAKVFVSKNSHDFDQDDLKEELQTHNCKYLAVFEHTLGYIHSKLS
jgi:predicted nucleic acid-binding protein